MTYSKKLKDPRWDEKHREILNRDDWTCQSCFCGDNPVLVYHKHYEKGRNPWDYENESLITLCANCYLFEVKEQKEFEELLMSQIKKHFLADDLRQLAVGFYLFNCKHESNLIALGLSHLLQDKKFQDHLVEVAYSITHERTIWSKSRYPKPKGFDNEKSHGSEISGSNPG